MFSSALWPVFRFTFDLEGGGEVGIFVDFILLFLTSFSTLLPQT
jgi:hypothetical protein